MGDRFGRFAAVASAWAGSSWSFVVHLILVGIFVAIGPVIGWTQSMLVLTTVLTVATELLAVLILNTQNRDSRALHLKLDELIASQEGARDSLIALERRADSEIEAAERRGPGHEE